MESTRQKKVSRLIQKELAILFQKNAFELFNCDLMISVTIVRVTKDMSQANIYLSIFSIEDPKIWLKRIIDNQKIVRKKLAQIVKNQLRIIPELKFYLDDSAAYFAEIESLLKK
tara:strand:+ start:599 stop:940 length:342 start_codon:yes stop_codon:yes gene_type:complete